MKRRSPKTAKYNSSILAISKLSQTSDEAISVALQPFGIPVTSGLAEKIRQYVDLLLLWNRKVNLTSICGVAEILSRHFGESMFAAEVVPVLAGHLVDVGSGAGFPGLALKLIRPELSVTLIEPVAKKRAFLREVVRTLGLSSVMIHAEPSGQGAKPVMGNFLTARAIGHFGDLLEWSGRSLEENGRIVLWLGQSDAKRIRGISGWSWRDPISIPRSDRRVLLIGSHTVSI